MNPITEQIEPMFSSNDRLIRYIQSFFICLPFFLVVFFVLMCFLNLTGIVVPDPKSKSGLFYIKFFADKC